jgi:hypothetical protein
VPGFENRPPQLSAKRRSRLNQGNTALGIKRNRRCNMPRRLHEFARLCDPLRAFAHENWRNDNSPNHPECRRWCEEGISRQRMRRRRPNSVENQRFLLVFDRSPCQCADVCQKSIDTSQASTDFRRNRSILRGFRSVLRRERPSAGRSVHAMRLHAILTSPFANKVRCLSHSARPIDDRQVPARGNANEPISHAGPRTGALVCSPAWSDDRNCGQSATRGCRR